MASVKRSLIYTLADSYLTLPLQLIGTMIMSRLLTPAELGVFAVAAVFASLASTFRDFGVAEYLIQEKELKPEHIRASLTANIVLSWAMALLLFLLAPLAADFYRTSGIADVMRVQAFNFVLIPFGAVTAAYFRREMNFKPIFISSMLANITSFCVSITCAYNGLSYMSLAWSSLAGVAVTVSTNIWYRPREFPKWPGVKGLGRVIQFGKFASIIYIAGQLSRGLPDLIIGRSYNMASVAIFSRGGGLVELFHRTFVRAVMPVCLPYFAKDNREKGSVVGGYLTSVSYLTVVGWPLLAVLGLLAFPAIRIVYGPQWLESVPLARVLCLAGALELVHYLAKEALIAAQDIKRSNSLQLGTIAARAVGLLAVVPFGLIGASYGVLFATLVGLVLAQRELKIVIGLELRQLISACLPSFWVTAVVSLSVMVMLVFVGANEENYLYSAVLGGTVSAVVWLLSLRLFRHPLWMELAASFHTVIAKFAKTPTA